MQNTKLSSNIQKTALLILFTLTAIAIIAYVDMIIRPEYWVKTAVKAPVFFCTPLLFALFLKEFKPFKILTANAKGLKISALLGMGIYIVVVGAYLLLNSFADLSAIQSSLENNLGINKDNFIIIGLYVCIINSFLEEWFFRGFIFTQLKQIHRTFAYIFSSLSFAVYHIAIMDGMFNIGILLLVLLGLFIGGCIFNYLNEKNNNIYSSWFCHAFANFAMNTIGFLIFF